MGHNDSKGGGGHGSQPLEASGQLGRGGSRAPGKVEGALGGKFVVQVRHRASLVAWKLFRATSGCPRTCVLTQGRPLPRCAP